jgi:hypothetical protein
MKLTEYEFLANELMVNSVIGKRTLFVVRFFDLYLIIYLKK